MAEHTVQNSRVEMTQVVLPQFANTVGTVFGGQVVSWIDICAAVSAQRHARSAVVTASIDEVHFLDPIKQGYFVILQSQINAAFNTSMEVGVVVYAENPLTGEKKLAMRAFATFVALDEHGRPKRVPQLVIETPDEQELFEEAVKRRKVRLQHRKLEAQKRRNVR